MPLCNSHALKDEAPRFLQWRTCDICANLKDWRGRRASQRQATATREKAKGPKWEQDLTTRVDLLDRIRSEISGLKPAFRRHM